jgi:CRP/FNR family transcriptional regulator, cyclic AMP receptor protein
MRSVVAKARKKKPFDVEVFLHTVAGGRSVTNYGKNQKSSTRETREMPSFISREARSRSALSPSRGKKRSSRS